MGRFSVIDSNILDKQGILNLLRQFIFGNSDIGIYDQDRVYKRGDKTFIIDTTTGDIQVVTAIKDNVTGPFDDSVWNNITLSDTIGSGADKVIVISKYRPRDPITRLWLTPDEFSTHYIMIPGYEPDPDDPDEPEIPTDDTPGIILTFDEFRIPLVDDTATADLSHLVAGDIVFDIESIGVMSVDGLTNIDEEGQIVIDEQADVGISANSANISNNSVLWIDTDLSDDIW